MPSGTAGRTEERLRLVVDATEAGIWDMHLGSGEMFVSERFELIMGYAPGKFPRSLTAFLRHIIPAHRQRVLDMLRGSVSVGASYKFDCRIRDAKNALKSLHVRGIAVNDEGQRPQRIVGVIVDTTVESTARHSRRVQDHFLAGVNAALPLIVYAYDSTAGKLLFSSRSFGDMLGYSDAQLQELTDHGVQSFLHPDDRDRVPANRARIARLGKGEVATITVRIRHGDGSWRWVRTHNVPLRLHADGSIWQIVGTAEDCTEQVLADERRRDQEHELARAQEIARVGSWAWHFTSESLSESRELRRILALDPDRESVSVATFMSRVQPEDGRRLRHAHLRCAAGGPKVDERVTLVLPDGARRHVHVLAELLRGPDDKPTTLLGTMQDVTEQVLQDITRAKLEAQVHQAQKLESLGLLAGGIAHDFNNLLVGVLSNASLALLDLPEPSSMRSVVLEIEQTAQRAADLTRQLLAYSGKGRFVVEPIDVSSLATEMTQLLRTVVNKDASLQLRLADDLPRIQADATQLRQVLMNLITNASDALEGKPGDVTICTASTPSVPFTARTMHFGKPSPDTRMVYLEVHDTGIGMTRDVAEKMFDPFFSTKFTGRGLGLAATLGIVRGHRGHIAVTSSPNRGTHFVLGFPTVRSHDVPPASVPSAFEVTRSGDVLIVDDDRVVRNVAKALLTRRGFGIEAAEDGRAALQLLDQKPERFRFVLLDLTMPGLSGLEVLQELRARERARQLPATPVFLMSGYSEQEVARGLEDLDVSGFLQKPFTVADLDRLLAALGGS